jgi:flavin-dependent dehydrogenase
MNQYDFIVIGTGPAGSMTAKILGEKYKVLVLEKMDLPRKKSCSGVLIHKAAVRVKEVFGDIPDSVTALPRETHGINVITSTGRYEFGDAGINVHRELFDNWLIEQRDRENVDLVCGAVIKKYDPQNVIVEYEKNSRKETAHAKAVIACDGINGISRSLAGIGRQRKIVTYQKTAEGGIDADRSKFYACTSPEYSRYDAWFNSKDGKITYGVSGYSKAELNRCMCRFESYMADEYNFFVNKIIEEEYWCLPLLNGNQETVLHKDNMFFCGESAGLLNPFGEGMYMAFESSYILASVIRASPEKDAESIAGSYIHEMYEPMEYMKRQWALIKTLAPDFASQIAVQPDAIS